MTQAVSTLLSGGHATRQRCSEVRASILDPPSITVTDAHEEKLIGITGMIFPSAPLTFIAHDKERISDRGIGFDERNPKVRNG